MMQKFLLQLATFFGVGLIKKAPGTWGTLAAVPLVMLLSWAGPFYHMAFAVILLPIAIAAAELYEQKHQTHDSSEIVIDEVLGFIITMTWLPTTWQSLLIGFFLFRMLDIFKPLLIGYVDRKVHGGLGVIADDVVAGICANIILQLAYTHTNWLGSQGIVLLK